MSMRHIRHDLKTLARKLSFRFGVPLALLDLVLQVSGIQVPPVVTIGLLVLVVVLLARAVWTTLAEDRIGIAVRLLAVALVTGAMFALLGNPVRNLVRPPTAPKADNESQLSAVIDRVYLGHDDRSGDAIVTVLATITNHGAPSVARRFEVALKSGDNPKIRGAAVDPERGTMHLSGPREISLSSSDYLPIKALDHPLPTGGGVSGFIMARFPGMKQQDVEKQNANVILSFEDATGREVVTNLDPRGN